MTNLGKLAVDDRPAGQGSYIVVAAMCRRAAPQRDSYIVVAAACRRAAPQRDSMS